MMMMISEKNTFKEQLELIECSKYARRYSPKMFVLAYFTCLIYMLLTPLPLKHTCKKGYLFTFNIYYERIRNISKLFGSESKVTNKEYLKLRISQLNSFLTNVSLLSIDEICLSKRIEYSGRLGVGIRRWSCTNCTLLYMLNILEWPFLKSMVH